MNKKQARKHLKALTRSYNHTRSEVFMRNLLHKEQKRTEITWKQNFKNSQYRYKCLKIALKYFKGRNKIRIGLSLRKLMFSDIKFKISFQNWDTPAMHKRRSLQTWKCVKSLFRKQNIRGCSSKYTCIHIRALLFCFPIGNLSLPIERRHINQFIQCSIHYLKRQKLMAKYGVKIFL